MFQFLTYHKVPPGNNIPTTNDSEMFLVFILCEF